MDHQLCARVFLVFASAALLLSTQSHAQNQMRPALTALPQKNEMADLFALAVKAEKAGDQNRAYELCEQVLQTPPPPGASAGSFLLPRNDFRGEARWMMAQIRRSQGRWEEALALYQLNRKTYPRREICVITGLPFQEMAINEGQCLEHLGRFDEAVALYLPAALHLNATQTPEAMRRLVALYAQTGQLDALSQNIAREQAAFEKRVEHPIRFLGDDVLDTQNRMRMYSGLSSFDRVYGAQLLLEHRKWDELVAQMQRVVQMGNEKKFALQDHWNSNEALRVLLQLPAPLAVEALPSVQEAQKHADNKFFLRAVEQQLQNTIAGNPRAPLLDKEEQGWLDSAWSIAMGWSLASHHVPWETRDYAPVPPGLKLPALLPVVFKASAAI